MTNARSSCFTVCRRAAVVERLHGRPELQASAAAPVPQAFKEPPPEGWKEAQPNDGAIRGKWWEIYNDPELNALEEQVSISNQNVLAAEAQFPRGALRRAHCAGRPVSDRYGRPHRLAVSRSGGQGMPSPVATTSVVAPMICPRSLPGPVDIWGSIRRNVRASQATAQADYALLENAQLSYQAELAQDYFQLHGTDGDIDLLKRTVKSYEDFLKLTQDRYDSGVASGADVAQAQTQLDTTQAQLIDLGVARAQYEHAIAILIGKPPAELTIPAALLKTPPPPVPVALPSALLERRPDIAAAERQMASVQEQIGIAVAAYYPSLTLSASGWASRPTQFIKWFSLAEPLLLAGRGDCPKRSSRAASGARR